MLIEDTSFGVVYLSGKRRTPREIISHYIVIDGQVKESERILKKNEDPNIYPCLCE